MPSIFISYVTVAGDFAYVSGGEPPQGPYFLTVIDISDLSAPTLAGSLETMDRSQITVAGDLAICAHDDGIQIYDISDPTAPTHAGIS
jgi:hypothetical protein